MNNNSYIDFIKKLKGLVQVGELSTIDPTSKLLLEEIALHEAQSKLICVSILMEQTHVGSAATIHRKYDLLQKLGLIETYYIQNNKRTKYIRLSITGRNYFEKMIYL